MNDEFKYPLDKLLAQEQPYAAIYAMIHGKQNLMSKDWCPADVSGYKSSEDVYKTCLEKSVTWQDLLHYKPDNDITY